MVLGCCTAPGPARGSDGGEAQHGGAAAKGGKQAVRAPDLQGSCEQVMCVPLGALCITSDSCPSLHRPSPYTVRPWLCQQASTLR